MVGRGGFEPPNRKELSYSQPRLATSLPPQQWCRLKDLNPQPTDYKSVALPIELSRQWWRLTGSNRWPSACKADALPTELNLHQCWTLLYINIVWFFKSRKKEKKFLLTKRIRLWVWMYICLKKKISMHLEYRCTNYLLCAIIILRKFSRNK